MTARPRGAPSLAPIAVVLCAHPLTRSLAQNPSALRRRGERGDGEPDPARGGWKLLPPAAEGAAAVSAKLYDSDEIALCLPSRVPGEDVTFILTLNKL